jgi:small-conductance mechanosensitive channel
LSDNWIQTKNLYTLLGLEPFLLLTSLILVAWTFYKIFLANVSEERHLSLRSRFRSLLKSYLALTLFFTLSMVLRSDVLHGDSISRLAPYVAVLTFTIGGFVFVQVSRLIILQYLFLGSIRAGVPILIVNIFSLLMSILLTLWGASQIFNIQVGPLLATSAAFSIILGLAIQDTLGNLFAGIAMQIDRVFEIGDWIEIQTTQQKVVGQVKEITWRATTLIGWSDEVILVPNRVVAGSSIANYQNGDTPLVRSQIFRLPFGVDTKQVKTLLLESAHKITEIRKFPEPVCFISEITDSWVTFKIAYYINSFGSQYSIADRILANGLENLQAKGLGLASNRMQISQEVNQ